MPRSTLSRSRVLEMLPDPVPLAELLELLERSKAEVTEGPGDELSVEVTPDRLDLLSEGGLGLYLQGAVGVARGLPRPRTLGGLDPLPVIHVDTSVADVRPIIAGAVVRGPRGGVDAGLLGEAVRFQEVLHATLGSDRRLASLGLYPYDRLRPPFRYQAEAEDGVTIVPLDSEPESRGSEFRKVHPLALRYGGHGAASGRLLTLRDNEGRLMSLPPIVNARPHGEVRVGDRTILIEATGTRPARVGEMVSLLSLVFTSRGWAIAPVRVDYPGRSDEGAECVESRIVSLSSETLRLVSGGRYSTKEVRQLLGASRLGVRNAPRGWSVEVPPWRVDLGTDIDLAEDVVLARGVRVEEGILMPSPTRGRLRASSRFARRMGELLLGAGYSELYTPVLVAEAWVRRLGRTGAIELANPVSDLFQRARDALQLSLVGALERNVRNGYPQRMFEVGPVVERDSASDTGATTRVHAALMLAGESAGFADAASLVEYVLGAFDAPGIREPAQLPGTIPGRAARVRIAGVSVAELGEIMPSVLDEIRVPVPAVWAELDLSRLAPLVGGPDTD